MAWKYACLDCWRLFKSARGRNWHQRRSGHEVFPIDPAFVAGLSRGEALARLGAASDRAKGEKVHW